MSQAVSPVFTSLGRRQAYVEVAEQIRAKILTDKLRLFARLPSERDLAAQFGVSRVVVREAIRTLESRGLVTVKKGPKGGIFVTQDYERPILDSVTNLLAVGEASLDDLFELRLLIEPYAAARLAAIGTADDFAKLDAVIAEAEREHRADHSIRDYYIDFHRSILRFTRNPLLGIIGETIVLVLYDRVKTAISAETTEIGLIMHRQLVDACRQRRDEEARSIMMQDIEILRRRFVAFSSGGNERAERGGEQKANGPAISGNRLW